MKYYRAGQYFVAEMPNTVFGERTHTKKTARGSTIAGNEGQGRCVGFLMAWLMTCDAKHGRDFHLYGYVPSLKDREVARDYVRAYGTVTSEILLRCERPRKDVEPDEPLEVSAR